MNVPRGIIAVVSSLAVALAAPGGEGALGRSSGTPIVLPSVAFNKEIHLQITAPGFPAQSGVIGCKLDAGSQSFDDCSKLPPGTGIGYADYQQLSKQCPKPYYCVQLQGIPQKAGPFTFRLAFSTDSGKTWIVRTYAIEVEATYDLAVRLERVVQVASAEQAKIEFVVTNLSTTKGAKSPPAKLEFGTKVSSGREADVRVSAAAGAHVKVTGNNYDVDPEERVQPCPGLVCNVPALNPNVSWFFVVTATLADKQRVGTYLRIRGDLACDKDRETSCDNNHAPAAAAFERVTIRGSPR